MYRFRIRSRVEAVVTPRRSRLSSLALAVAGLVSAACGPSADAQQVHQSEEHRFRVDTVATGLENPWGIAFLPGGDMLVTERAGRVRIVRGGRLQAEPVAGAPEVRARGQGGLLDIVLHPRFAENRYVYLTYSKPGPIRATTAVARARFDGERLEGLRDLLVTEAWGTGGNHFGSRIVFDSAGLMYVTVGERNERQRAQDLGDHAGTVLRLHDDGRVPRDNPFVGRPGARPEIFSYGHRNAQGADLHPSTGELWLNEHGPRGGDEINIARAGRNYGWPVITFGREYSGAQITADTARSGMEQPVLHWTPSIAVSGMAFYTGDRFPAWRGNLFNGALAAQQLRRVVLDGNRAVHQETLLPRLGRIRTVKMGPDGYLYLLIDAPNGSVLRLVPA